MLRRFPMIIVPKRPHTPEEQVAYITYNMYKNGLLLDKQLTNPDTQAQIEWGKALHEEDEEFNKKVVPINIFEQRRMRKEFEDAQARRDGCAKSLARTTDDFFMGAGRKKEDLQKRIEENRRQKNLAVLNEYRIKKKDPNGKV